MSKYLVFSFLLIVPLFSTQQVSKADPISQSTLEPKTYEEARSLAKRTVGYKNLWKIGLAFHGYHDLFGQFPPAVVYAPDGKTPHSWRVELLPVHKHYVEGIDSNKLDNLNNNREHYNALIKECGYDIDEPWDSPANLAFLKTMPPVYRHASDKPNSTESAWYAVVGNGTAFDPGEVAQYKNIKDWPASTLMLAESRSRAPWTKPVDIDYSMEATVPRFGGFTDNGFLTLSCDGGVHFISDSVSLGNLRAFISKDPDDTFEIVGIPYRY